MAPRAEAIPPDSFGGMGFSRGAPQAPPAACGLSSATGFARKGSHLLCQFIEFDHKQLIEFDHKQLIRLRRKLGQGQCRVKVEHRVVLVVIDVGFGYELNGRV